MQPFRKILCLLIISFVITQGGFAQYNLNFEEYDPSTKLPSGWTIQYGDNNQPVGSVITDQQIKHSGSRAVSIERTDDKDSARSISVSRTLPADFDGVHLTVGAWIKTERVENRAVLFAVAFDEKGERLGISLFPNSYLQGSADWTFYKGILELPEHTHHITVGFSLIGKGKMWVDDFLVMVDGEYINAIAHTGRRIHPAATDNIEFIKGSDISDASLLNMDTADLVLLGKIWGFLKYYHPAVARGDWNWDYALFRFLPNYSRIHNKQERNDTLLAWINRLGSVPACATCNEKTLEKALHKPDLDWLGDENELGSALSKQLLYIKTNRSQGKQYYIGLQPSIGYPTTDREQGYKQFSYPDAGYRLLSVYRFWNLVQYWFPYKYLIGEPWDNALAEFIPKMLRAKNAINYAVTVNQLVARIHDSHAVMLNGILNPSYGRFAPPVKITFLDNQPVVSAITLPSLAAKSGLRRGDVIRSINGEPVADIIKRRMPDLNGSNLAAKLRYLSIILLVSDDSLSGIEIERNDSVFSTTLVRTEPKYYPGTSFYPLDFPYQKDSSFFFVRPGIGYMNMGAISNRQIDSAFILLKNSQGLIIDLRQYPVCGLEPLTSKLLSNPKQFAIFSKGNLNYPGMFGIAGSSSTGEKNKHPYQGQLIILVNEYTQSQAEFYAMALRLTPSSLVVGSQTSGADGNSPEFKLPGGLVTSFTGIGVYYPDGSETQRIGIVPDINVKRTVSGIKNGMDDLLEKAVQLITEKSGGSKDRKPERR